MQGKGNLLGVCTMFCRGRIGIIAINSSSFAPSKRVETTLASHLVGEHNEKFVLTWVITPHVMREKKYGYGNYRLTKVLTKLNGGNEINCGCARETEGFKVGIQVSCAAFHFQEGENIWISWTSGRRKRSNKNH